MGRKVGCLVALVGVVVGVYLVGVSFVKFWGLLCAEQYDQIQMEQWDAYFTSGVTIGTASFTFGFFCFFGLFSFLKLDWGKRQKGHLRLVCFTAGIALLALGIWGPDLFSQWHFLMSACPGAASGLLLYLAAGLVSSGEKE
jgi:hypothetical protein